MSALNSISSTKYLLYLIIFIISGCAEKATTHAFIQESHPSILEYSQSAEEHRLAQHSISGKAALSIESTGAVNKTRSHPSTYATVWEHLFSLYALPEVDNKQVENEVQRYLKHPEYLSKIQQRAEPYLYFILEQIEAKKIPGELALLPIVESAFRPQALSKSKASGLWQFMPATGRFFGLKQNWWYDGRKDVYTSTQAATTYLKQLGNVFDDDWFLALAAYNAGKGNIRKAIRKNKEKDLPTDYWSLPLRQETKTYVPRLLAIAKILANAERYNIPLLDIPNAPHFEVVHINSQIDLSIAAKMADTSLDDFFILNPAFKRSATAPDGPFHLLIHTDKTEVFKAKLAKTQKKDRMNWLRHKIKAGENLGSIAKKYNLSVIALLKGNHLKNSHIRAGKYLLIPSLLRKTDKHSKHIYTVKKGDTFWDIARQFDVHSKDIANWNNISLDKMLRPGQKLIIKKG